MKNLILFVCICISISVIFSCKIKEEDPSLFYDCTFLTSPIEEINLDHCTAPSFHPVSSDLQYHYPVFNPLNSNELILFHNDENNFFWELWRYDICSGNHVVIADSVYYSQIDWNPQNWILYANYIDQRTIYKVRGNKVDGEKVSNIQSPKMIKWKTDGSSFMTSKNSFGNGLISVIDHHNMLDFEIPEINPEAADWKNNLMVFGDYPYIKVYDLETSEIKELEYDNSSVMKSVHFFKDNYVIWNTTEKIAYTDLITLEQTIIREAKPNQTFHHLDISLDEQTIVLDQAQPFEVDDCVYEVRRHLSLMNIDGTNERIINIPL